MKKWFTRIAISGLIILACLAVALVGFSISASNNGVVATGVPVGSDIESLIEGADYLDAYRIPLPDSVETISMVEARAFQKGELIKRTNDEVVYSDKAPGLRFVVSYFIERADTKHLVFTTAVFYETGVGSMYFTPVKPIHKRLAPFMVGRMF